MHLFPEETLAASVTITVWVGVWVVVFFNLRLGWTLSGLIVPGYLVPLMLAKPLSAGVIAIEAVITYLIVWSISEVPRWRYWCSFFGRDRFFAMVIVSVIVRCLLDGWLLPWLGAWSNESLGLNFDYRNHLHSYGLIVVALMANYFWKPGLRHGAAPLAITIGLTYLIVRYVLIEFTNFNVASLQYVYEDIASSLLASPKSYMILITTAWIASWMNLRFGWEFNGILIPALLALQWYAPLKILASFVEAGVILLLATMVLRLPLWRGLTIEGGRKILLFFNIAFIYRLLLGVLIPRCFPHLNVSDLYGFGYLLSTLLAIRAHEMQAIGRLTRASLEISMMGAVLGSCLGFLLTLAPGAWFLSANEAASVQTAGIRRSADDLVHEIRSDKLSIYQKRVPNSYVSPTAHELSAFAQGLRELMAYADGQDTEGGNRAAKWFAQANYDVHLVEDRYLYLRERTPTNGWGMYALDLQHPQGCLVSVPAPLDEWGTAEAGLTLFRALEGHALAIAGASRRTNKDGSADVLHQSGTIYGMFHRMVGRGNSLHVRGHTRTTVRKLATAGRSMGGATDPSGSSLWIKGTLPRGVNLQTLEALVNTYTIHWRAAPLKNILQETTLSGIGELFLTRDDRRRLYARIATRVDRREPARDWQPTEGDLGNWLLQRKADLAAAKTDLYQPPQLSEMLYLDEEVLQPLLVVAQRTSTSEQLSLAQIDELSAAASAAHMLDYRLTLFRDLNSGNDFFILAERPDLVRRRYWGTYVFRLGQQSPFIVQVPRPIYEKNTWEFGVSLMGSTQASALLLAGAHPRANRDGSSDLVRITNKINPFQLVHQVLLREVGDRRMLVVQTRAIKDPVKADVVVATEDGSASRTELSYLKNKLVETMTRYGLEIDFVDGSKDTAGYELGATAQAAALQLSADKEMVSLWLSSRLRTAFTQYTSLKLQESQFESLGIRTIHEDLFDFLHATEAKQPPPPLAHDMVDVIQSYLSSRDIVALRYLQTHGSDYSLTRLVDRNSQQSFLIVSSTDETALPHVVGLADRVGSTPRTFTLKQLNRQGIQQFIASRSTWLQLVDSP